MIVELDPLEETLPQLPFEPAPSLASRLAAFHRAGNVRQFCWDQYLRFERIAHGDRDELTRFSTFVGADLDELARWTPSMVSKNRFTLNGEMISSFRSCRIRVRLCPACAEADMAAAPDLPPDAAVGIRAYALVESIRTCPIHGLGLVQVADRTTFGDHDGDYAIAVDEALEDFDDLRSRSVRRPVTGFEAYLLGRLGVLERRAVPLLDALDISQVTTICERLGVFDLHGRKAQIKDFDEAGMLTCAEAGLEWLERGETGVRDFVTMAHDRAVRDSCTGMSNGIFGRFHYFLNAEGNLPCFEPIRQIIVDRLSEIVPYGPEDPPLFGVRPARRYWHTLISAERQYGIAYRTIKTKVERAGIHNRLNLDFDKTRFAIGVDELDALLTSPEGIVTRVEVIERTGAHAHDFIALQAAGLLVPVEGKASAANASYRRGDVDELEKALLARAVAIEDERSGWVSVHQAYLFTSWSRGEVFGHIAAGAVATGSVKGLRSIASIRVDLDALRRLHPLFGREVMSMEEAANLLEVSETVVNRLVKLEWIGAYEERSEVTGKLRMALLKDDVLAFGRTYIPVSEIWRRRGGPMSKINPLLRSHGLEPAFPAEKLRCTFYPRAEVDRIFPPKRGDQISG